MAVSTFDDPYQLSPFLRQPTAVIPRRGQYPAALEMKLGDLISAEVEALLRG